MTYEQLLIEGIAERDKRITELEVNQQWISVEDRLPDELQDVLSFSIHDGVFQSIYRANKFKKTLVVWLHNEVTHWMPLPASSST